MVALSLVATSFAFTGATAVTAQAATTAHVVSHAQEGQDHNNVVCGGVPSKALLIKYASGGKDSCGHADIKAIWAADGITLPVAKSMVSGTVCSTGGFTSNGRQHSPVPSADKVHLIAGSTIYFRPLSVWGKTCYAAWVGHTEDGRTVAVLKGCGNGEATALPPSKPAPKTFNVLVTKIAESATGQVIPTPTGTFRFLITAHGYKAKIVTYSHASQVLEAVKRGTVVTVTELSPLSNEQWKLVSPRTAAQKQKVTKRFTFVYKDQEVSVTTPATAPTPVAPVSSPTVTNPCQGFSIPGEFVSGSQCAVNVCGVQVVINGNNYGTITINVSGNICSPSTTTTPPPTTIPPPSHYTQVSCTGFEEISGGGSFIVKCAVSDDNGASISLTANSNNANSRVSGINCYSQGGTPSCSGNGTYEFRVTGVNSGSTVLSSSVTVQATANGIPQTWNSDPFPVDPSSGGF
jgi:hypothetical protein